MTKNEMLEKQMKICELYANYWMALATTGAATNRIIKDGYGREYTDEEKIQEALDTSVRHIHRYNECLDAME